jgi:hypothetical protein
MVSDIMREAYKPRLTIEITEQERNRLSACIPHGVGRRLFSVIIDSLCTAVEKHGELAIAAIITKRVSILDVISVEEEGKNEQKTK